MRWHGHHRRGSGSIDNAPHASSLLLVLCTCPPDILWYKIKQRYLDLVFELMSGADLSSFLGDKRHLAGCDLFLFSLDAKLNLIRMLSNGWLRQVAADLLVWSTSSFDLSVLEILV